VSWLLFLFSSLCFSSIRNGSKVVGTTLDLIRGRAKLQRFALGRKKSGHQFTVVKQTKKRSDYSFLMSEPVLSLGRF